VTGELNLRAMGLVYTTLLSLVPLAAFAFAVLKGLGVHRDLEPLIFEFLRPIGERAGELTTQFMHFVDNVRGDVLGSVGLAILSTRSFPRSRSSRRRSISPGTWSGRAPSCAASART
jgi:membrane protein